MDAELQKIIIERTRALPSQVKEALKRIDVQGELVKIFKETSLRVDQSGALETETLLVILGVQPTNGFAKNIQQYANVSQEEAQRIATLVNERIFKAIRLDMAETTHKTQSYVPETPDTPPSATTTPPPPANLPTGATLDPVQQKLEQPSRLAPDTVVIKKPALSSPIEKGTYPKGSDPYREPLN